jgi:hypothetical protein
MGHLAIETTHHRNSVVELAAVGGLTVDAVADLRRSVYRWAAEMPSGIVLDLNRITDVERVALLTIPALQGHCAEMVPPIALVVHAHPHSLAAHALASHLEAQVTVFADLQTAAGYALAAAQPWPTARLHLTRRPATVGGVSRFVHRKCADWLIPWVANRTQLVADELVANALAYSPGAAALTLSLHEDQLRVGVRDTSPRLPHARLSETPSLHYGLGLVDLLATRWGTFLVPPGKIVWADVSLTLQ